jgi:hypothetical protein
MPKRSSTKPNERDANLAAFRVVQEATQDEPEDVAEPPPEKNPAAVALGKLGGLKGGKARAEKLSDKRRSEIAKKAAEARWKKEKGESGK